MIPDFKELVAGGYSYLAVGTTFMKPAEE